MAEDFKRLDPAAIADSFVRHPEIAPVQEQFYYGISSAPTRCCGLFRAAMDSLGSRGLERDDTILCSEQLTAILGIEGHYGDGFCCGWDDNLRSDKSDDELFMAGYEDGRRAWELTEKALEKAS